MGVQNITTVSSFIEFHAVAFASSINICTDYTPLRLWFDTKNVGHTLIRRSVLRFHNLRCSGCTISWHVTWQTRPKVQLPQYKTQPAFKSDIIYHNTADLQTCCPEIPRSWDNAHNAGKYHSWGDTRSNRHLVKSSKCRNLSSDTASREYAHWYHCPSVTYLGGFKPNARKTSMWTNISTPWNASLRFMHRHAHTHAQHNTLQYDSEPLNPPQATKLLNSIVAFNEGKWREPHLSNEQQTGRARNPTKFPEKDDPYDSPHQRVCLHHTCGLHKR